MVNVDSTKETKKQPS